MSFPFYSRSSSKLSRAKKAPNDDHQRTFSAHATAFRSTEAIHEIPAFGHTRSSSKIRILPFLGKKRKSMAALRTTDLSSAEAPSFYTNNGRVHNEEGPQRKTVSQLADECVQC